MDGPGIHVLSDGNRLPALGFGVWQMSDAEAEGAVSAAIETGYRLIDTAQNYANEAGVGRAVRQSGIARGELFITSKLRNREQGYDSALKAFEGTLERMGLDYLDMFLIHWPVPAVDRYVDTWRALMRVKEQGLVRTIGVSNFLPKHIDRIITETGMVPAVDQIELHPRYQQRAVRDYHKRHSIQIESYSPLGRGRLFEDPVLGDIAARHGKSPAQVMIRWQLQEGLVAIPKSADPARIASNFDVFDFSLGAEDMARIDALDDPESGKMFSNPDTMNNMS
jgi:2,5-diketo-D-gluconate reductase A